MKKLISAAAISLSIFVTLSGFSAVRNSYALLVPPTSDQASSSKEDRQNLQTQFIQPGEQTTISGKVSDAQDKALQGTAARLFISGVEAASTVTDAQGAYSFTFPVDYGRNETIVLWFIPADTRLLPKIYVLKESKPARENKLFSPCVPRVELGPLTKVDAQILDAQMRTKQVILSDCLK